MLIENDLYHNFFINFPQICKKIFKCLPKSIKINRKYMYRYVGGRGE